MQCHHIASVGDRKATRVVRFRAGDLVSGVGRIQLTVDGREGEVDVPVNAPRVPSVRRHTVNRKVGPNIHHPVTWTEGPPRQQPWRICHTQPL